MVENNDWRDLITDERERATLDGCETYAQKPFGDVGHNLKMLVAHLAKLLDEKQRKKTTE